MQKLFKILLVGLAFLALNVGTVSAQIGILPTADDSARPIGEGGEGGGPAAVDMNGNMINDGGHGANSGKLSDCDYRCTQLREEEAEAAKADVAKANAEAAAAEKAAAEKKAAAKKAAAKKAAAKKAAAEKAAAEAAAAKKAAAEKAAAEKAKVLTREEAISKCISYNTPNGRDIEDFTKQLCADSYKECTDDSFLQKQGAASACEKMHGSPLK
jgi:pyruvate/2-oxoglutarate dehydrogenase complex dihydrolipoamide acyltransferase (E2) component